jgi:hypothetical protein
MQRLADALPADRAASRFLVSSDPDEHVEGIKRYLDLGRPARGSWPRASCPPVGPEEVPLCQWSRRLVQEAGSRCWRRR